MSHTVVTLAAVGLLTLLVAPAPADDPKNEPKAEQAKRLSADELQQRLLKHLQAEKPKLNLGADFALKELTTDAVWKSFQVQVVKIQGDVLSNQTFVIRKDDVFEIGQSFGGDGVTSLVVADLNKEGKSLLYFSYAWGSGEHRSQIAAVDFAAKQPKELAAPLVNYTFKDYTLKAVDAQTIEVFAGTEKIGKLGLEKKDEQNVVQIRLDEKVPAEIKDKLKP